MVRFPHSTGVGIHPTPFMVAAGFRLRTKVFSQPEGCGYHLIICVRAFSPRIKTELRCHIPIRICTGLFEETD